MWWNWKRFKLATGFLLFLVGLFVLTIALMLYTNGGTGQALGVPFSDQAYQMATVNFIRYNIERGLYPPSFPFTSSPEVNFHISTAILWASLIVVFYGLLGRVFVEDVEGTLYHEDFTESILGIKKNGVV